MTEIPIAVTKCKVGPITERYQHGEFQSVETEKDGVKRVAICGLDNSHNGDYKVAYASDPVLVVHAEQPGFTHEQLRAKLEEKGLWVSTFQPIEKPKGNDQWLAGFQSSTESATRLSRFKQQIKQVHVEDTMPRTGDTFVTAWV